MPFTLAHPAAVLPLRRTGLPLSALVAGSMVPDAPVFLDEDRAYDWTHAWWGVVSVDVVLTLVTLALWFGVVRDPLVDLSPRGVRNRLPARARLDRRAWTLAPVAAAIGSATHVLWDAFTHVDTWGTRHVAWLREEHLGVDGYLWAQFASGIAGLVVLLVVAAHHLRRSPVIRDQPRPRALTPSTLPVSWGLATTVGLVVLVLRAPDGLHLAAFDAVVTTILVAVALAVVVTAAWHVRASAQLRG